MYLPSGTSIGVGYQVHYLANALVRRGHDVTVFSQTGAVEDSLYHVVVVPSGRRMRTFGFAWNLRKVDFTGFDALNAHGDDWFLWGRRRPWHVHTYHGSCLAETLRVKGAKERVRMALLALCETQSTLLPDVRVAVSENTRRWVPRIDRVISCGVDAGVFRPGQRKSDRPSILFVGVLDSRKRGRLLLDVFLREVRPAVPDAELWIVRDPGPVEAPGVRCFGAVALETLAELYRKAWLFCLPSTYEGFGVPYVEAMASGTPVVASPNPGALEVTRGGADGLVVEDGRLGATLTELLQDAQRRRELAARGLERARDFSWDRVCRDYEEVYRREGG